MSEAALHRLVATSSSAFLSDMLKTAQVLAGICPDQNFTTQIELIQQELQRRQSAQSKS
jgi:hypothetical protein